MSTNPQSPQGSPSEARGSQSPSHPVAEGRQSPGLAPSEGEAKLWGLLDDIDTLSDMLKPEKSAYYEAVNKLAGQRFKVLTSDGYNLFRATPSQEEGPAGVDLEAAIDALSDIGQEICEDHCDHSYNGRGESDHCSMCKRASEVRQILRRLRAQAPASSPRDLEAGDLIRGMVEFLETYKAQGEMLMPYSRQWVGYAKRHLAAHPPKGETPSEAAREGLHQIMRDAATITQRLTGDVIVLADRIHDIARASLSSLPQEGAAGEGGAA